MHEIDAGHRLEELAREMRGDADTRRGVVQLPGMLLCIGDELAHAVGGHRGMHDEHVRLHCDQRDWREVLQRVVAEPRVKRMVRGEDRVVAEQPGIPIRRALGDQFCGQIAAVALASAFVACGAQAQAPATKTLKMQSSWPASNTLQEHFKMFGERVDKLTQGGIKIEALPAGQIVPAFEVLDAANKKVIDGWHSISYYWVGKSPAAAL